MIYWIKKTAMLLGYTAFFGILFFCLFSSENQFDFNTIILCLIKALLGGGLFWFLGFILGDIIFKGVLTDVEIEKSNLIEGGLIQRITSKHESALPGGPDMPLIDAETGLAADKIKSQRINPKKARGA
ncbi:MAG TPA: hypothetical protein VHP36_02085 [Chitinispirillaceae bacterium]|nr:hypothetical protein [Chitinispirillaceae bacterium]